MSAARNRRVVSTLLFAAALGAGGGEAEAQWRTFQQTGSLSARTLGDNFSAWVELPFQVNFFGHLQNYLFVGENGYVTREQWQETPLSVGPVNNYDPYDALWTRDQNILAPLFTDYYTNDDAFASTGEITYGRGTENGVDFFAINWMGMVSQDWMDPYQPGLGSNTFQLVLWDSGPATMAFNFAYQDVSNVWDADVLGPARAGWSMAGLTSETDTGWYEVEGSGTDLIRPTDYTFSQPFEVTGTLPEGGTVTPEPASMLLLGSGLAGLGAMRRRRRRDEPGDALGA